MLGYWWGVLGVIMVPQSDLPPKPLGATVPQSSLFRWKWAPKLKPLPLHSSKALDSYFWAQSFLGVDKLNHKKKSKISENRLNRLVNYIRLMVLLRLNSLLKSPILDMNWPTMLASADCQNVNKYHAAITLCFRKTVKDSIWPEMRYFWII